MSANRIAILCIVQALQDAADDAVGPVLTAFGTDDSGLAIFSISQDNRQGRLGRQWVRVRNAQSWFFEYALRPEFRNSVSWKAIFRVPHGVFCQLVAAVGSEIAGAATRF